jgi:ornithine cyclodeaminase
MLVLSGRHVQELLDLDALIDALGVAMADLSAGRVSIPPRSFAMVEDRGLLAAMPAYLRTNKQLAAKLVLVFPGNAGKGIPTHQALVSVFDSETGVPLAIMDGASVTAIRTGAGSALATRLCARADARVLAIIGTGVQARSHARAVPRVRDIDEIIVAGRDPEKVSSLADEIGGKPAASVAEAVNAADIVCVCTHAHEPVVRAEWLRPGTHVNAVGFTPGPELEPAVFKGSLAVVESRDAAIGTYPNGAVDITTAIESGILDRTDVREVGELVDDRQRGRTDEDQITVYRSVGVAAQDAVAAELVLAAARRSGAGTEVEL